MKKFKFIFFVLILSSCSYKVYINGRLNQKADKSYSYKNSTNDSCIILDSKGNLPASALFLDDMRIKYGYSADSFVLFSIDYSLLEMAKTQAKKFHANVVKITAFKRYFCCKPEQLVAKLYCIKNPEWENLKKQADSLNYISSNFQFIHVKRMDAYPYKYKLPLYLNDHVIGYFPNSENSTLDFSVTQKNDLSLKHSSFTGKHRNLYFIDIDPNKEYYIHITYTKGGGHIFETVSKYDF